MWSALGSEPLNATAQWEGEGGGRGTWTILSTSIVTLILCVWTAVHMNIPREGHGSAQTFAKARWMLMALFAPEVVSSLQRLLSEEVDVLSRFKVDRM